MRSRRSCGELTWVSDVAAGRRVAAVAGATTGYSDAEDRAWVRAFDLEGTPSWTAGPPMEGFTCSASVDVGSAGDVFVAGRIGDSGYCVQDPSVFVARIHDGEYRWVRTLPRMSGTPSLDVRGGRLALGTSHGRSADLFVMTLDGAKIARAAWRPAEGSAWVTGVAIAGDGATWATGGRRAGGVRGGWVRLIGRGGHIHLLRTGRRLPADIDSRPGGAVAVGARADGTGVTWRLTT
jgi:hypothetical protein